MALPGWGGSVPPMQMSRVFALDLWRCVQAYAAPFLFDVIAAY